MELEVKLIKIRQAREVWASLASSLKHRGRRVRVQHYWSMHTGCAMQAGCGTKVEDSKVEGSKVHVQQRQDRTTADIGQDHRGNRIVHPGREVQPWTKVHSRREKSTLDGKSPPWTRSVHPGREKSTKFKSSMDRKGRGYATSIEPLSGPNVNLNGLGTRTPRPQSTSGARSPTMSMMSRTPRARGPTVSKTAQKSLAETNAGANHIEADD